MKIDISSLATTEDQGAIITGLGQHVIEMGIEARNARSLFVMARDDHGKLIGGVSANTVWGWLQIKEVWVASAARRSGIGTQLMAAIEQAALKRDCHHAMLDTFDFQARPFYEKLGYVVFGELPDFPRGHQRYFMSKSLTRHDAVNAP